MRRNASQVAMSLLIILALTIGLPTLSMLLLYPLIGAWSILLSIGAALAGLESLEWLSEAR